MSLTECSKVCIRCHMILLQIERNKRKVRIEQIFPLFEQKLSFIQIFLQFMLYVKISNTHKNTEIHYFLNLKLAFCRRETEVP